MKDTENNDAPKGRDVAEIKRAPIIVQDVIPVLDTGKFEQMQRIAVSMAAASLIPSTLRGKDPTESVANCFLVVNQAVRWKMDPFALAQHVFVLHGKLGYEGKVIAAVVNGSAELDKKLSYEYTGENDTRQITVSATLKGETKPRTITGTVANWKTPANENWKTMPDQMLAYRGAREWARRHMPGPMLGVFSDDEVERGADLKLTGEGVYVPEAGRRPQRDDYAEPWIEFDQFGGEAGRWPSPYDFASNMFLKLAKMPDNAAKSVLMEWNEPSMRRLLAAGLEQLAHKIQDAARPPEPGVTVEREDTTPAEIQAEADAFGLPDQAGTVTLFHARAPDGTEYTFPTIGQWAAFMGRHITGLAQDETRARLRAFFNDNEAIINGLGQHPQNDRGVNTIRAHFARFLEG